MHWLARPERDLKPMALLQTRKAFNLPQAVQQALDFQRQGRLPQAEKLYTEVLRVRPDYFEALHMLALIKMQNGDPAGALRLMMGALKARPKSPEVLFNYSLVLNALGRYHEALVTLDLVLSVKRRSVEAQNNRGAILEKLGRDEEALECLDRALAIKAGHIDALYNRGSVLRKLGRYEEALKCLDHVLAIKPDYIKAHNNRGIVLEALDRRDEALASYERTLALDPNFVEALNNRANTLHKLGRHEEAVACYEQALAIDPRHAEVLNNRSNALSALGRQREALESVARATSVNSNYVNAQWNEALLRLRLGEYSGGWEKYEWRWKRDENAKKLRTFAQPLWLGQAPVAGKTILLHHEQGFGDTIQFARYATMLAKQGARVILEVQPPLKSLLSQIGGDVQVIGSGEGAPSFDLHCPLLSLPLALRTELATIPADIPYLTVPSDCIERWNERLPPRRGLRVGLVWAGSATHKDDHNRSIALARLSPLFDVPEVQFVSLQKDLREADAQLLAREPRIADVGRYFGDFCDTAAVVALVDLVISVDTSVAHLAGALGKPVWVLLPLCADWRWLTGRDDSPWYPTARLFRQPGIGDWDSAIAQVRRELTLHADVGV
jgi:tetratricopeptide (TPR) repeat protein